MKEQFDLRRFVVCERFVFCSYMGRKPGKTVPELAGCICQDASIFVFHLLLIPLARLFAPVLFLWSVTLLFQILPLKSRVSTIVYSCNPSRLLWKQRRCPSHKRIRIRNSAGGNSIGSKIGVIVQGLWTQQIAKNTFYIKKRQEDRWRSVIHGGKITLPGMSVKEFSCNICKRDGQLLSAAKIRCPSLCCCLQHVSRNTSFQINDNMHQSTGHSSFWEFLVFAREKQFVIFVLTTISRLNF